MQEWDTADNGSDRTVQAPAVRIDDAGTRDAARARSAFFGRNVIDQSRVRAPIAASWQRARERHIDVDRVEQGTVADVDPDSILARAARPIIEDMAEQLANEPTSVILCDAQGVILERRSGDSSLTRYLDTVGLVPGFSYAEQFVGTNGIGTALEDGEPIRVFGHEHYAEGLVRLACAGYPIKHPQSGAVLGVVDLTCWGADANRFMTHAVTNMARRVTGVLWEETNSRQLSLARRYLTVCDEAQGAVFAVDDNLLMMNEQARTQFSAGDHAALLAGAQPVLEAGTQRRVMVDLPSGATARVHCLPAAGGGARGILKARMITDGTTRPPSSGVVAPYARFGVVGSAPLWGRCTAAIDRHIGEDSWMMLEGESGAGKTALAVAAHRLRRPTSPLVVVDLAEEVDWHDRVDEGMNGDHTTVVLRHLESLDSAGVSALVDLLEPHRESHDPGRPTVIATFTPSDGHDVDLGVVMELLTVSVAVPPLRHHIEDLDELIPHLLGMLGHGTNLSFTPAAVRNLKRNHWPENVRQLRQVVLKLLSRRRSGVVDVDDLPIECRLTTRRVLTPLEAIECDAIATALNDASGDKVSAARQLGMSRATIYRKIREYGLSIA
ncbi:sigma-54-dependent Fis family transcriptional regulator [Pseudonocardia endophytica]|uniref:GAF modulated Fis family sigma54 specific transcriptional regulator n=1 Tax=Pseudonocardia endophytica TaxID=401976 RepID=A0A4R1HG29_PSEEN|nr:helix-turn-helix domain-containing protein [Pseudonocardia endophytica]TCK21114.1 GAF modulated Fis family sigma54 specific transcriptional regulator [Pseudonocardia endophytica]